MSNKTDSLKIKVLQNKDSNLASVIFTDRNNNPAVYSDEARGLKIWLADLASALQDASDSAKADEVVEFPYRDGFGARLSKSAKGDLTLVISAHTGSASWKPSEDSTVESMVSDITKKSNRIKVPVQEQPTVDDNGDSADDAAKEDDPK